MFAMMYGRPKAFKERETILDSVFAQLESAIRNACLYKKIEELSIRDPLTGLYNRRYLNLFYNDKFISVKVEHPVSAALIDIDHFKKINDTYGHLFGDVAIKAVASRINECAVKNGGFSFRYGGEEFVILIDDCTVNKMQEAMEDLRTTIKNTVIKDDKYSINVNVSIGITSYPDITGEISTLIDRADKAMYYSKQHGRDRITLDDGSL